MILPLACLVASQALAATSTDWAVVQQLASDSAIEVHAETGKVRGLLRQADAAQIVLATKSGDRTIPRTSIRKVKVRSSSRRAANAAIAGAIGFGAAAVFLGVANARSSGDGFASEVYPIFGGLTGGISAGVAALFPGYRTVYRSQP